MDAPGARTSEKQRAVAASARGCVLCAVTWSRLLVTLSGVITERERALTGHRTGDFLEVGQRVSWLWGSAQKSSSATSPGSQPSPNPPLRSAQGQMTPEEAVCCLVLVFPRKGISRCLPAVSPPHLGCACNVTYGVGAKPSANCALKVAGHQRSHDAGPRASQRGHVSPDRLLTKAERFRTHFK